MRRNEIVIVAAKRTPVGVLNGALASLQGHELGSRAIAAVLEAAGVDGRDVDEVIMGQVLTGGAGMNPARQASRDAGVGDEAPAMVVNQVCGSGLRAIALGAQQIETGCATIVVAGGQESMSNAPHAARIRPGKRLGDVAFVDTALHDGLTDAFSGEPMGVTAENIAQQHDISRAAQDEFALASQVKAATAARAGRFAEEIVPVSIVGRKRQTLVKDDEYIRFDADAAGLARLRPVFDKAGTVTAGNSSGVNDGAAAVVLMSEAEAERRELAPMARIRSWAQAGIDPSVMGLGPIPASRKALHKAGWAVDDVDFWEINEAFAAQSLAVIADLGMDPARVNINGGAIAIGHPIGASGARVLTTLIHTLINQGQNRGVTRGLATLCIGGGMGIAMCIECD